jgi:curved DNA-binding protein CbpA
MIDYYSILGIPSSSSKLEIKKAYRRLALIWHPDKNHSPNSSNKFIEINEAYLILSDEEARVKYDYQFKTYNQNLFNSQSGNNLNEEFADPVFENWRKTARQQAENYSSLPFEKFSELLKSLKDDLIITGSKSILYALSRTFLVPGIGGIFGGLYFQKLDIIFVGIIVTSVAILGIRFIKEE